VKPDSLRIKLLFSVIGLFFCAQYVFAQDNCRAETAEQYYQCGLVNAMAGNVAEALDDFEKVRQIDPDYGSARAALSPEAVERGKVSRAVGDFKSIKTASMAFYADTGNWPDSNTDGSGLVNNANTTKDWDGPYLEKWPLSAPWGGAYRYEKSPGGCYLIVTKVPGQAASDIDSALDGGDGAASGAVRWVSDPYTAQDNNLTITIYSENKF